MDICHEATVKNIKVLGFHLCEMSIVMQNLTWPTFFFFFFFFINKTVIHIVW